MNSSSFHILAVDGHDGSGKTTLAKKLAEALHAIPIRPYDDHFGPLLIKHADARDYGGLMAVADQAIRHSLRDAPPDKLLIFDRCWITLFTLLPEAWHVQWKIRPPTAICWADMGTTLERVSPRNEQQYSREYHQRYIGTYQSLGIEYRCEFIYTHLFNEQACLRSLKEWAAKNKDNSRIMLP